MGTAKLLLPYNFTEKDRRALNFTVSTFVSRPDIEVTLFHGYPLAPSVDATEGQVTERLKGGLAYLQSKLTELESEFETVRDHLIEGGFAPAQVRALFRPRKREVAAEIIELHRRERFQIIVMSRSRGRIGRFFGSSVHAKLFAALGDVTVCVVS
jgi:hypothetical protein